MTKNVGRGRGRGRGIACGQNISTAALGSAALGSGKAVVGRGRSRRVIVDNTEDQGISRPQGLKRRVMDMAPEMPVTVRVRTGAMMCGDGKELDKAINYMG